MSLDERQTMRRKAFKKGLDMNDARRRREDEAVALRKQQKDDQLMKKRFMSENTDPQVNSTCSQGVTHNPDHCDSPRQPTIAELASQLSHGDLDAKLAVTRKLRKILSVQHNPPIGEVVAAGITKSFVRFLGEHAKPDLQFESAWVLTNIASGTSDETEHVVDAGALPACIELLRSENMDVREQAVWAIGNISGDAPNFRDLVLNLGGLGPLLSIIMQPCKVSMLRNTIWAVSNLFRGKPFVDVKYVRIALPALVRLLDTTADNEVITDCCWCLSYMADGDFHHVKSVVSSGVIPRLVQCMKHDCPQIQTPALRACGNIVTSEETETQAILDAGGIFPLVNLLRSSRKDVRREATWMVSNIMAGTSQQIQVVIDAGIVPMLIEALEVVRYNSWSFAITGTV